MDFAVVISLIPIDFRDLCSLKGSLMDYTIYVRDMTYVGGMTYVQGMTYVHGMTYVQGLTSNDWKMT